jgi:hypothetical protein
MYTESFRQNALCRSHACLAAQAKCCKIVSRCPLRSQRLRVLTGASGPSNSGVADSGVFTTAPDQADPITEPQVSLPDSKGGPGAENTAWGEDAAPEDWSAPKPFSLKDVDWGNDT